MVGRGRWCGLKQCGGFLRIQKPNITTHTSTYCLHKTIYKHTRTRTAKQTSIKQECINTYNEYHDTQTVAGVRAARMFGRIVCSLLENANMLTQCYSSELSWLCCKIHTHCVYLLCVLWWKWWQYNGFTYEMQSITFYMFASSCVEITKQITVVWNAGNFSFINIVKVA